MEYIAIPGNPMINVGYGWTEPLPLWKYAHVLRGSTVVKTFHGPGSIFRAIRFARSL